MRSVSDQTVSDPASQLYNQGLNARKAVLSPAAFASPPCTHSSAALTPSAHGLYSGTLRVPALLLHLPQLHLLAQEQR